LYAARHPSLPPVQETTAPEPLAPSSLPDLSPFITLILILVLVLIFVYVIDLIGKNGRRDRPSILRISPDRRDRAYLPDHRRWSYNSFEVQIFED
jgi:hypothetical protein